VGLNIRVFCTEELLGTRNRKPFRFVDVLAAAVIAAPGIAFGIFIGQDTPGGLQNRPTDKVLRRDQLQRTVLASKLVGHGLENLWVGLFERTKVRHRETPFSIEPTQLDCLCLEIRETF
jgi:hypothetical protein